MKKTTKLLALLLALCLTIVVSPAALADDDDTWSEQLQDYLDSIGGATSGSCGQNLTWRLRNGTVTISGTGEMYNYYDFDINAQATTWRGANESITSIVVKDGVTSIGDYAFEYCSDLTDITLPDTLTSIGEHAFIGCSALANIELPSSLTTIGAGAFSGCTELASIEFPSNLTTIGEYAFKSCSKLESVEIPNKITEIPASAFNGCANLTTVTIPNSVKTISGAAFWDCPVTNFYYDGSKTEWEQIEISFSNDPIYSATIHYADTSDTNTESTIDFTDVSSAEYYYTPVSWAVDNNITTGTTATTFSPNETCTRGQIITFLWRAVGSPEPTTSNAFTDVSTESYYYKAIQWAHEKNIDESIDTFSPGAPCTRAMVVEYLWRLAGSPQTTASSGFTDVSASDNYANAVAWAVEQGITTGTSDTTFSPADTCTRGQIVTFLWRDLA